MSPSAKSPNNCDKQTGRRSRAGLEQAAPMPGVCKKQSSFLQKASRRIVHFPMGARFRHPCSCRRPLQYSFFGRIRHLERWQPIRNFQCRLTESDAASQLFFCNKRTCPYCRQMKKLAKAIRLIPTLLLFLHKNGMGMDDRIRIKDIAAKAGVSVGTVDRVLHKRPNVSKSAREKVERILREIDYRPNAYASALACNKDYVFCCILPEHASEAYWEEIELGAMKAVELRRDFHLNIRLRHFSRLHPETYLETCRRCLEEKPDGIVLVPTTVEETKAFTDELHRQDIPFVLLDSNMPDLEPLSFYGQDSFQSGYFAARMLMLIARKEESILLVRQTFEGKVTSRQQENREVGFRRYMEEHYPEVEIKTLNLPMGKDKAAYHELLEDFFHANPGIHHCFTTNSRAYITGGFLLETNRRNVQIMGYDMVPKNAECMRKGSISFLIAQHAYQQGFSSIDALFRNIVLKKEVRPINYMPIELLSKENVDFYHRTRI